MLKGEDLGQSVPFFSQEVRDHRFKFPKAMEWEFILGLGDIWHIGSCNWIMIGRYCLATEGLGVSKSWGRGSSWELAKEMMCWNQQVGWLDGWGWRWSWGQENVGSQINRGFSFARRSLHSKGTEQVGTTRKEWVIGMSLKMQLSGEIWRSW